MTIVVHTPNAKALWASIQDNLKRTDDVSARGISTWRKDDTGRAVKIFHSPLAGGLDDRAYFVGTVRTGQLMLLDLLPGSAPLNWTLFGLLHGHLVGMLMTEYESEIMSLNVFPNRPAPDA
ncbi:hypothetical protein RAS12_03125 [Achromobacter seleniivolatilans]|uniref:SRPBCC family protein n=1 Tax=Achromobacter seleniivolatilans TaxID=3047478 RepID=A0ABY9M305_9BURK|nr:hypothetical protein [Achromobacter sp. R39]WMD21374.1 hypothetical protein RAS12_03125 [Achromobacter sp. R39]